MEESSRAGRARKTGNVVLARRMESPADNGGYACAASFQPPGLSRNGDPKKIEQDLMKIIPQNKWIQFPTS